MDKEKKAPKRIDDTEVEKHTEKYNELQNKLNNEKKQGFKKLSEKEKQSIIKEIQTTAQILAQEFVSRYQELCEQFNLELSAKIETDPQQCHLAQASLEISHLNKQMPEVEKHSEFLTKRLKLMKGCSHILHELGNNCERCGVAPAHWGNNGNGISPVYRKKVQGIIAKNRKQERQEEETKEKQKKDKETTPPPTKKSTPK